MNATESSAARPTFLPLLLLLIWPPGPARAQGPLYLDRGQPVLVPMPGAKLETVLNALFREEGIGRYTTAIPEGTRLLSVRPEGASVTLGLSRDFLRVLEPGGRLESALEQIVKTAVRSSSHSRVSIRVRDEEGRMRPLSRLLAEIEQAPPPRGGPELPASGFGVLSGKTVFVSPGHGYYWHSTLGWRTQRPLIGGLIEDLHTAEIATRYLIPYLENMGATVIDCRERGEIPTEHIGDNDQGWPVYRETGLWTRSLSSGYRGGSYRFAASASARTATAAWSLPVARGGVHPVWVWYVAGTNRSPLVRYEVHHSGGVSEAFLDQRRRSRTWVLLGSYHFEAGSTARVVLDNKGPGGVVIADAVRIGAGMGSIVRGPSTSKKPRWQECSRYWAEYQGAPSSVFNSSTGGDHTDDVTARPRYAEWVGGDCYVSLHTNAGGGSGTSSYIHNTNPSKGSAALQQAVQSRIVADIRASYDPTWIDRGRRSANFGEVRLLKTMPGVLVELAFHDVDKSRDHNALHDPKFRRIAGRAFARGVLAYFKPSAVFPPPRPTAPRVQQDGRGGLTVSWDPVPGADFYSIEESSNGKGFVEVAQTNKSSWSTGPLVHGSIRSFRVRAWNASGRSFPTETLTAGTSHDGRSALLLVQGFDRLGKFVKGPENTGDYLRLHGEAIGRNAEFSLGFDAASNEAVVLGRVGLAGYRAVDWALGEESTRDETFTSAEQLLVRFYLNGGGRLLVSGSEIGWDLDRNGSIGDRDFYRNVLGARYVRDDAGSYAFRGTSAGVFAGLLSGRFDDGRGRGGGAEPTYDVDYPDVIAASDSRSVPCLLYGLGSDGAAIQRISGTSRVIHLGFPLETILDPDQRAWVMRKALRFLLAPRALEMESRLSPGGKLPIRLELPAERGRFYVLAASARAHPGIPLGGGLFLPLNLDPLLSVSAGQTNGVFNGFGGFLDQSGRASASIVWPKDPRYSRMSFVVSGLTLGPSGLGTLLDWYRVDVR